MLSGLGEDTCCPVTWAFRMGHRCPVWHVPFIDNPLRRLLHDAEKIFAPFVRPGMTVLDIGCGGGFATTALARLVGPEGRVIAADVEPRMLELTRRRAERAGLANRIELHHCGPDRVGVTARLNFVNAFWVVHEVDNVPGFLAELREALVPGGLLFVAEPIIHVSRRRFFRMVETARSVCLDPVGAPRLWLCRTVVLARTDGQ